VTTLLLPADARPQTRITPPQPAQPAHVPHRLTQKWHTPCFDNLNKLTWVDGFGVQTHGVRVGVRVSDPALIPILKALLPAHAKPCMTNRFDTILSVIRGGRVAGSRVRNFHMVYQNHTEIARARTEEDALDRFQSWFALSVAFLAPRRVFVHAGAVEWKGRAILLPGKSLAGKSTLTAALVRAGARYLSDEFAVLDGAGNVHAWPKPISMRETPTSKQVDMPIEAFGGQQHEGAAPPGLVVMTHYKEGATWRPRRLGRGEAMLALLDNCIAGRLAPTRVLDALDAVTDQAVTIKSPRGPAEIIAKKILSKIEKTYCKTR